MEIKQENMNKRKKIYPNEMKENVVQYINLKQTVIKC